MSPLPATFPASPRKISNKMKNQPAMPIAKPIQAFMPLASPMAGWLFILYEIFLGEAGKVAGSGDKVNKHVKSAFGTMRIIVTAGWPIYPLGYHFGPLAGAVQDAPLNLVYNLADFVNKIAFCLAIWQAAKQDTVEKMSKQGLLAK